MLAHKTGAGTRVTLRLRPDPVLIARDSTAAAAEA